jgi:hypothetical protein
MSRSKSIRKSGCGIFYFGQMIRKGFPIGGKMINKRMCILFCERSVWQCHMNLW